MGEKYLSCDRWYFVFKKRGNLFCFQFSASGFISIITRKNVGRQENYGSAKIINYSGMHAYWYFFKFIPVGLRLYSVSSWPWVTDPHYQFSDLSYCRGLLVFLQPYKCLLFWGVNMFTPFTLFSSTPIRQYLSYWTLSCYDFPYFPHTSYLIF